MPTKDPWLFDVEYPPETCHVYIIGHLVDDQFTKPTKVGITANLGARLRTIQTGNPLPVTIAQSFAVPNRDIALEIERTFHGAYAKKRMEGEWFDLQPIEALFAITTWVETRLKESLDPEDLEVAMRLSGIQSAKFVMGLVEKYLETGTQ